MSKTRLVVASGNPGKLREFEALLQPRGFTLIPQQQLGVSEASEPHETFVENALAKARHASRATGLPALADDSGLCVPALAGAPGVYSARYAALRGGEHSDAANNARLVEELRNHTDKRGYYVAVLVLMRAPDDPFPLIAEGTWDGIIVDTPSGQHGFGYDPHFFLPEEGCTVAELPPERKNELSHRAKALHSLLTKLDVYA